MSFKFYGELTDREEREVLQMLDNEDLQPGENQDREEELVTMIMDRRRRRGIDAN